MKKANLGGRWGEIAAFKFFIGFQVGRIFLRWYMTGKSRSRCCTALTLWLWSPRSQKPCWHAVRLLSPQFLPCLSYLHRTFHFSVTLQIQATLSVGSFWPPLGALAHNYFYKNLLPLLHSLLTSLSSASPILLCGCWNLDTAKAPAVSAIAVYHPAHPSVFTHESLSANYVVQWGARMDFGQHPACRDPALCKHPWAQQKHKHIDKTVLEIETGTCHKHSQELLSPLCCCENRSFISLHLLSSPNVFRSAPRGSASLGYFKPKQLPLRAFLSECVSWMQTQK